MDNNLFKAVMEESHESFLANCQELLSSSQNLLDELKIEEEDVAFLTNEYKTNKKYFSSGSGQVTIKNVIETAYELAWSKCKLFYKINQ